MDCVFPGCVGQAVTPRRLGVMPRMTPEPVTLPACAGNASHAVGDAHARDSQRSE